MLKKLTVAPARPQRAETRLSPVKAAVSERPRRILSHPAHPELRLATLARWYVEALSDARRMLEGFCSILRLADRYGAPFGI